MEGVKIQIIGMIAVLICQMSSIDGAQDPQFRVTHQEGRERVSPGDPAPQAQHKEAVAFQPSAQDLAKWCADDEALTLKGSDTETLEKKQAELEAEVERQARLTREQKKTGRREERWYPLPRYS